MAFFDWIALAMMALTLLGVQFTPNPNVELERTTQAQSALVATADAQVTVGGIAIMRFADTGTSTALERALEAKGNLKNAIQHHQLDLPGHYVGPMLRLGGDDNLVTLNYMDLRITSVTVADAKANHLPSARDLAQRWRDAVDQAIVHMPAPLPEGWIAADGRPTPSLLVSDPTLAQAVADCLPSRAGEGVTVKAAAGTVILSGQVTDDRERGRIVRLVQQVPGVREVIDHTTVVR